MAGLLGQGGPEVMGWFEKLAEDHTIVMRANTYRVMCANTYRAMSQIVAENEDPTFARMSNQA